MTNQTILLVEDDDSVAGVVQLILRRIATVERVATGHDALARVARGGVDLIVLDLGLPDLNGTEVCRLARIDGYAGAVLVLTAQHGSEPREQAFGVGADDFLNKPFTIPGLLARVRRLLDHRSGESPSSSRPGEDALADR
jgi:DNA-binding response OmpR family regulator